MANGVDTSNLGFEAGFGTGDTFGTGIRRSQFTWQDLLRMFANSSGTAGVNSQQLPFTGLQGNKQQNPGVPLYNPLQPFDVNEEDQKKQSSVSDIAKYINFFAGLF